MVGGRFTYVPDDELVVVLPAERGKELFIVGEGETLDQHLVQFEALHDLQSVEVPNDDVRLNTCEQIQMRALLRSFI